MSVKDLTKSCFFSPLNSGLFCWLITSMLSLLTLLLSLLCGSRGVLHGLWFELSGAHCCGRGPQLPNHPCAYLLPDWPEEESHWLPVCIIQPITAAFASTHSLILQAPHNMFPVASPSPKLLWHPNVSFHFPWVFPWCYPQQIPFSHSYPTSYPTQQFFLKSFSYDWSHQATKPVKMISGFTPSVFGCKLHGVSWLLLITGHQLFIPRGSYEWGCFLTLFCWYPVLYLCTF